MDFRTVTYNPATHKIVPIEPTEAQIDAMALNYGYGYDAQLTAAIASAPEYQEPEIKP